MAEFSAKDVMALRARTNAGMMESKKALTEADGNMDQAVALLRKWGAGSADSKMANEMKEGLVAGRVSEDGRLGVLLRLGCQTDFVARTEGFQKLLKDLLNLAFTSNVKTPAELNALNYSDGSGRTVEAVIKEMVGGTVKENIAVTGVARFQTDKGLVGKYIHHNDKVGALVQVDGSSDDAVRVLLGEIAMHVTAGVPFVPIAISRDQVAAEHIERETAAGREAAANKPEKIQAMIIKSRLDKFFAEQALLEQPFVKDEKKTIQQLVSEAGKAAGATLTLVRFARFKVGEE
jgi:elongation factor Ts